MRPVNLIPQDQRRRRPSESSGKGAHALLGLLAVLLAMTAAYVLTANTVTDRKNETEQARAEADRLEAEAATKGSFSEFEQIAQTRAASVVGVASTRFDWERFMRELSRVMPEGSWLTSASASVTACQPVTASSAACLFFGDSNWKSRRSKNQTPVRAQTHRRIAMKWLRTNLDWFNTHGNFLEKYNVVNTDKPPAKGVYPSQTGFGWTNAVFERFCREFIDGTPSTIGPGSGL
jgi:hypothetical protein